MSTTPNSTQPEIRRIGKKRWGVFLGARSQLVLHEFRGSYPSAKRQFVIWKITRRVLGKEFYSVFI